MYTKNNSIKFFEMMPILDLKLMYTRVVELDEPYLFTEDYFKIHLISLEQN